MLNYKGLALKIPVAASGLLLLAGCYTVLRHPATDLTARHDDFSDCASCHTQGFEEPLISDPYLYVNDWYWSYYGCPWWLPDCGFGIAYGAEQVVDGEGGVRDAGRRGRYSGSRGNPAGSGFITPPPAVRGPGGVGSAAPGSRVEPGSDPSEPISPENPNRTAKPGRKSDPGPGDDGTKDKGTDPARDKTKDKDKPEDKP